jgi:starch synthase (maltosyl-transferring)
MAGLRFHDSDDPRVLCYSKPDPDGPGGVLIVVNLDPHARHGATVDVDWAALDLAYDASYELVDLLGGGRFTWHGARNYVELEAHGLNAHVFAVSGPAAGLR